MQPVILKFLFVSSHQMVLICHITNFIASWFMIHLEQNCTWGEGRKRRKSKQVGTNELLGLPFKLQWDFSQEPWDRQNKFHGSW